MLKQQSMGTYWEDWADSVGKGWNQFWFTPASSQPLSVVRIATGLLAIVYFVSFSSDLQRWFAPDSLIPSDTVFRLTGGEESTQYHYTLLSLVKRANELYIFHSIGIAAAACLAAGF